ncbi:hypothetical protein AX774_g1998 [Zancudomyces culisetae]|uniref:Activator of Hsp90 ATPase AHSA1-like N-terminal domain-containing protein n=1 Tax=Zancudomyces culisetae TaxID=1213189 RepID=A0A1R1PU39_ZANCU|nr:hypothetical protein AX774_g1998 [Zancudomyces culisetae]|eukprot:OMH84478.1 hypothetical protein AX774_g1998 [Zancudomyces culisetae]
MSQTNWKNVNNWHWTEKNCLKWSKEYFEQNLKGIETHNGSIKVYVDKVDDVKGDAILNQRKGKIITLYDLEINMKWKGENEKTGKKAEGSINVPEVAHDSELDDYVFDVRLEKDDSEGWEIKEIARKELTKEIKKVFAEFSKALINENLKDVYIEKPESREGSALKSTDKASTNSSVSSVTAAFKAGETGLTLSAKATQSASHTTTGSIKLKSEFMASSDALYDALTNPERAAAWTRDSKAQVSDAPNSPFVLFGGNVTGEILESTKNKNLVLKWRNSNWPQNHFSRVSISLSQTDNSTILELEQSEVPIGELEITERNWEHYYFSPIKSTFGWGFYV